MPLAKNTRREQGTSLKTYFFKHNIFFYRPKSSIIMSSIIPVQKKFWELLIVFVIRANVLRRGISDSRIVYNREFFRVS